MQAKLICGVMVVGLLAVAVHAQQPVQAAPQNLHFQPALTFEENAGQTDHQVKFLSRSQGYTAFLTAGGVVLSLHPAKTERSSNPSNRSASASQHAPNAALEFKLVGAAENAPAVGEDLQPGKANYFIGNDSSKWHTNVRTYGKVRYKNIYPGIDLIYYGNHRQLEYDFVVAPNADPANIQFEVKGATGIELDSEGNLVVHMADGNLHFQKPTVYQESNGLQIPVQGEYDIYGSAGVGFRLGTFDHSKPLVIDPVLVYSTYLGGSGNDQPSGIAVDSTGCVYVVGYTDSTDFPLAALGSLPPGLSHVFVAKFDATGSNLIYADYIGGSSQDYGYALTLNSSNEVYVAGNTSSSDFPVVNAYQSTYPGSSNAFLTRVSSNGSALVASTYLGGNGTDVPASVALDSSLNVIVAGTTSSTNFPVANAYQSTANANGGGVYGTYGFITKFTPNESAVVYSTYLAGSLNTTTCGQCWGQPSTNISALVVDSAGNAYVAGDTNTYDFPVSSSAYQNTDSVPNNGSVGFVTKMSSAGVPVNSTYFYETSGFTSLTSIAVDSAGSAYITGSTFSDGTFPVTVSSICDPNVSSTACSFAFVSKFDPTLSTLAYSTFLGVNNYAFPSTILLDKNNDAYVLSTTSSNTYTTTNGLQAYGGGNDILLTEIDPVAGSELFSTYFGGTQDENATSMAFDLAGNLYITGNTISTDLPTTQQAFQKTLAGNTDAFVAKIGITNAPFVTLTPTSLTFAAQPVGSPSPSQPVVLRNLGIATLTISSVSVTGDFAQSNNCGTTVAATATCTLSVTFTPTASGQRTGTLSITDNAPGSPHIVTLNGTGSGAAVSLSPSSLVFPATALHVSSAAQTITFSNQGSASLTMSSVQITGDFSQTNNCPTLLAASASCTFSVIFSPSATGTRTGSISISDSATGSPQTVALSGTGSDFKVTSTSSIVTVSAGGAGTFSLSISGVGGSFPKQVQLTCSGAPATTACSISPASVTPGSGSASATLTITTTSSSSSAAQASAVAPPPASSPRLPAWIQLSGMSLFAVVLVGSGQRNGKSLSMLLLTLVISSAMFMSACAGGTGIVSQGGTGTPSGSYTITVTGTSGSLQHSLPLTLKVK